MSEYTSVKCDHCEEQLEDIEGGDQLLRAGWVTTTDWPCFWDGDEPRCLDFCCNDCLMAYRADE